LYKTNLSYTKCDNIFPTILLTTSLNDEKGDINITDAGLFKKFKFIYKKFMTNYYFFEAKYLIFKNLL